MPATTYSSIANTSFSFLLTVDEFRNAIPEDVRPSWIKITTMTLCAKFPVKIDVHRLKEIFKTLGSVTLRSSKGGAPCTWSWKESTTFYNQITLTYTDVSTKSIKMFPNGAVQIAGARNLFDCCKIVKGIRWIVKNLLKSNLPLEEFRVAMINSNFSLNYNLNLIRVSQHFSQSHVFKTEFEPSRYSAVKVKFKPAEDMKQVTCSIFSTGKIIITGAETLKEIAFAYNIIVSHINTGEELRTTRSDQVETFDDYLGYKSPDLVKYLRDTGYHSWMHTTENRQIKNF
jgi:TATA-box binding protein (TBP) (component of TFIID and TFIIIB)